MEQNEIIYPTKSPSSVGAKWGFIGGLVLIALSLVMFLTGMAGPGEVNDVGELEQKGQGLSWIISLVAMIGVFLMGINEFKSKYNGGMMSFGQGFTITAIASVIMALLSAVFIYVYFAFIDPDIIEMIREVAVQQMEDSGQDSEQASQMLNMFTSPGAMAVFGGISNVIMGIIIGLIVSAITKK